MPYIDKVENKENVDVEIKEMAEKYNNILSEIKKELNLSTTKSNKNVKHKVH